MRRYEFLKQLKEALGNDLDSQTVQGHVRYYTEYIEEELSKGRTEEEIMEELGDPWVIARNLVDSPGQEESYTTYQESGNSTYNDEEAGTYKKDSKWKKIVFVIAVIGILFLVLTFVMGVFRVLLPVIIPVVVVLIIIRMFKKE